tara:strand:+ start:2154 stop:3200 length:1047 start_codon:yes stop_codon:yes gene_type:complete
LRLLVTGGAGFIGSNYILNNIEKNIILNFDKLTYAGNIENLKSLKDNHNYIFQKGDINNFELLDKTISDFNPDSIINFAAESHVDRSIDDPTNFIKSNILGTYELLKSSLKFYNKLKKDKKKLFKVIHISTDEVYGSLGQNGKFSESSPYAPSSPYSASKAASDHLVNAWYHTYGLPTIITNCSNNYGPYQFPEKLIPLMIINCLEHKPLPIYGHGNNIRDWIYVDDHCKAINKILKNGKTGSTYNIGGNQEYANIEIVQMICEILDQQVPSDKLTTYKSLIKFVKDRPGHDFRYAINSTKIESELNFYPSESFKTGLKKTIEWYLSNLDWINKIRIEKYNQERLGNI